MSILIYKLAPRVNINVNMLIIKMDKNFKTINNQVDGLINYLSRKCVLDIDYSSKTIQLKEYYKTKIPELASFDFFIHNKDTYEDLIQAERMPIINTVKAIEVFNKICDNDILFNEAKSRIYDAEFCWVCGIETLENEVNEDKSAVCQTCTSKLENLLEQYDLEQKRAKFHMDKVNEIVKKKHDEKACYVATLVYKDNEHPNVEFLRKFRDEYLFESKIGFFFITQYYKTSPLIVKKLEGNNFINHIIKKCLSFWIKIIKIITHV